MKLVFTFAKRRQKSMIGIGAVRMLFDVFVQIDGENVENTVETGAGELRNWDINEQKSN